VTADRQTFDVLIVGAGMVGATAACLLARAGFSVAVLEALQPDAFQPQSPIGLRVSAFSPGSECVLAEAGAWRQISQSRHCVYRRMQIEDRNGNAALELNAGEFGMECLGTIVENNLVQWSLWQCLQSLGGLDLFCPAIIEHIDLNSALPRVRLQDGREIQCRILVAADGGKSAVRSAAGIGQQYWDYGQQGIVAVVKTAIANHGLAWQRFLPGGPVAFLPLDNGTSSIVWSQPDAEALRLLGLSEQAFCDALNNALGVDPVAGSAAGFLFGSVTECGPRAAFPLRMQVSDTYAAGSLVLMGDAAHVVHPLAGQGVNIGLLDAAALLETLVNARKAGADFASAKVLQRYARWRRSEAELMAGGIHGLRSLFMPEFLTPLRHVGLGLVARSWVLKEALIRRAAGRNRDAPALARGVGLAQLLRAD
jgi:2-octaprenyl-3-methyl-6-methoxy-1,4-benzoquinol hydroxylase/2-octaprenylphenol hydroxylase